MAGCRLRFRVFALMWGALQFVLPFAVLLTDASLTRAASRGPASHVEASSSPNCVPAHTDECALCRFLSNNTAATPRTELAAVAAPARMRPADCAHAATAAGEHGHPNSRAPPVA